MQQIETQNRGHYTRKETGGETPLKVVDPRHTLRGSPIPGIKQLIPVGDRLSTTPARRVGRCLVFLRRGHRGPLFRGGVAPSYGCGRFDGALGRAGVPPGMQKRYILKIQTTSRPPRVLHNKLWHENTCKDSYLLLSWSILSELYQVSDSACLHVVSAKVLAKNIAASKRYTLAVDAGRTHAWLDSVRVAVYLLVCIARSTRQVVRAQS